MISPAQCRSARILLDWSAQQTADAAGLGIASLKRFESGQVVQAATIDRIAAALERAGVVFIAPGEQSAQGGAGVRLADGAG